MDNTKFLHSMLKSVSFNVFSDQALFWVDTFQTLKKEWSWILQNKQAGRTNVFTAFIWGSTETVSLEEESRCKLLVLEENKDRGALRRLHPCETSWKYIFWGTWMEAVKFWGYIHQGSTNCWNWYCSCTTITQGKIAKTLAPLPTRKRINYERTCV